MIARNTLVRGLANGARITWELAKIIVPVTIAVTFLEESGRLPILAKFFAPFMGLFGLPGEAALAFVLGNLSTLYAGIGVLVAIDLTAKQLTVLGAMLLLCHSLLAETAIVIKAGAWPVPVVAGRLGTSLAVGFFLNLVL